MMRNLWLMLLFMASGCGQQVNNNPATEQTVSINPQILTGLYQLKESIGYYSYLRFLPDEKAIIIHNTMDTPQQFVRKTNSRKEEFEIVDYKVANQTLTFALDQNTYKIQLLADNRLKMSAEESEDYFKKVMNVDFNLEERKERIKPKENKEEITIIYETYYVNGQSDTSRSYAYIDHKKYIKDDKTEEPEEVSPEEKLRIQRKYNDTYYDELYVMYMDEIEKKNIKIDFDKRDIKEYLGDYLDVVFYMHEFYTIEQCNFNLSYTVTDSVIIKHDMEGPVPEIIIGLEKTDDGIIFKCLNNTYALEIIDPAVPIYTGFGAFSVHVNSAYQLDRIREVCSEPAGLDKDDYNNMFLTLKEYKELKRAAEQ